MNEKNMNPLVNLYRIQPENTVNGLGLADRQLLATCVSLFEDNTLGKRLDDLVSRSRTWLITQLAKVEVEGIGNWLDDAELNTVVADIKSEAERLRHSSVSDDELRLRLWIYLREAFELSPKLAISERGLQNLADELAASTVHASDPPSISKKVLGKIESVLSLMPDSLKQQVRKLGVGASHKPLRTLDDVVMPLLLDLLSTALKDSTEGMDSDGKAKLILKLKEQLSSLDDSDLRRLLDEVGAQNLNDDAIRNIFLTSGGLAAFSGLVASSGFGAYILAAQASAFIPLVSGPALVSLVSVLSNPIAALGGGVAIVWWLSSSAKNKVRVMIALRVVALLALTGANNPRRGFRAVLDCFSKVPAIKVAGLLEPECLRAYRQEWDLLQPAIGKRAFPDARMVDFMSLCPGSDAASRASLDTLLSRDDDKRDLSAVTLLTLGDIAYSAAAIDPMVIAAADFSRAELIGGTLDFGELALKISALSPKAFDGAADNLKGYVAEQLVAVELVAQGHQVEFPEASNEAGWDLLVDGECFQVKCLESVAGIKAHFEKYDYPVIANAELAAVLPDELKDRVFFVEGYTEELAEFVTHRSLESGADLLDPDVPVFAFGVCVVRNTLRFRKGEVSGAQALEQIILDGTTRAGLAAAGGYVGSGLGLLVFGPAGALVLGATLPVLAQAQSISVIDFVGGWIYQKAYKNWQRDVDTAIEAFVKCLETAISQKIELIRNKYRKVGNMALGDYIRWRFMEDARFLRECRVRLEQVLVMKSPVELRAQEVIRLAAMSTIHPSLYQQRLKRLNDVIRTRPTLKDSS